MVYMAGILLACCQLVVLDTEEFRGHIMVPTSVNAMLLGFFLSDSRAIVFWRSRLQCWHTLSWWWAAQHGAAAAGEGDEGAGGGSDSGVEGGIASCRKSTTNSVNLQPVMELCVRDLP